MSYGDAFDQFQILLNESVSDAVENLQLEEIDDPMPQLFLNARNIPEGGRLSDVTIANLTPGYQASWRIKLQRGGMVTGGRFGQTQILKAGPGSNLVMGVGQNALHVDPTKVPQASYLKLRSNLKKVQGAHAFNFEQMEAKILSNPVGLASEFVEDITYQVRDNAGNQAWGNGYGVLGELDEAAGASVAEGAVTWVSIKNSQIFRFHRGQSLVASTLSSGVPTTERVGNGTSPNTPSRMWCVGINERTLEIGLEAQPGEGTITLVDGDALVHEGFYDFAANESLSCNGVESLLKTSGAFPDSEIVTDVTDYPELQAFVEGDESALEEPDGELLDELLDRMTAGQPNTPPLLIAENSLWSLFSHLDRAANGMVLVPMGQPYVANGGVSAPMYSYNGRTFMRLSSPKCRPGTIYALDSDSFIRFMPTDLTVRWRTSSGGVAGAPNIFEPVHVGSRLSDLMAAYYDAWYQFSVIRPKRNIMRKGLYNQRTYNAAS